MKAYTFLAWLMAIPLLALSQEEDYSRYPGFVDLSKLNEFKNSNTTVEIFITKPLLSLIASSCKDDDPPLVKLISNLVLIRVDQFSVDQKGAEGLKKFIQRTSDKLARDKWEKVIRVRDPNEHLEFFIKGEGKQVAGLLVMSIDTSGEATFVNIVGKIDMESLNKLGQQFQIPKLDSLSGKEKQKAGK
ncbi:MAG: DUF4252 domain-containing protein [candidate division KSB1 bacterium]|nr:DUF4252 domain-containing protein [candidate division KSB1 bacterium]MDZ7318467.1 DUF4252 domain-containing protein [candidate division KSB1 bacterium]MDZ7340089.1 DUF4252 domain-containing protein [candidate division KSB1 bacterium]